MTDIFNNAEVFNGDLSKWDVSRVEDMAGMFRNAVSFNQKLCGATWVHSEADKKDMFTGSSGSIQQSDCASAPTPDNIPTHTDVTPVDKEGTTQVTPRNRPRLPFVPGSTASPVTKAITQVTSHYVTRVPLPDRELIVRAPTTRLVGTPSATSMIATTITCPKCGSFAKSGRVSCCAPGGAWYKNCGGAGNRNVDHRWSEGLESCTRKFRG